MPRAPSAADSMGLMDVKIEIHKEDRPRVDRALDIVDRLVKVLERIAGLIKEVKDD